MIIWSGLGILWPIAALLGPVLTMLLFNALGMDLSAPVHQRWGMPLAAWSGFATAYAFSATLGRTREQVFVDSSTGREVIERVRHTLFFIPVRFYSYLLALLCLFISIVGISADPASSSEAPSVASTPLRLNEKAAGTMQSEGEENEKKASPDEISAASSNIPSADSQPSSTPPVSPAAAPTSMPEPTPEPPTSPTPSPAAASISATSVPPLGSPDPALEIPNLTIERVWTDAQGRTMTARLHSATMEEPRYVTFLKSDGKQYRFPLAKLSPEDIQIIRIAIPAK
jgi:hypothetical protein